MPPSGYRASRIAGRLYAAVLAFADAHALGAVTPPDGAMTSVRRGRKTPRLLRTWPLCAPIAYHRM
jgi:hypothetical protein